MPNLQTKMHKKPNPTHAVKYIRLDEESLPYDCVRAIDLRPGTSKEAIAARKKISKGIASGQLRSVRVQSFTVDRMTNLTTVQYSHPHVYREEAEAFLAEREARKTSAAAKVSVITQPELQFDPQPTHQGAELLAQYQRELEKVTTRMGQMLEAQQQTLTVQQNTLKTIEIIADAVLRKLDVY